MAEKNAMAIHRDVRLLFTKGNEAVKRDNFDYAIDLLGQALVREPGFVECRRALRKAQQGKADSGKTGFFKKVFASAGSTPLIGKAQLALRSNPADALAVAEQVLNSDPHNAAAHKIVVEAAKALELPQTALMSLEIIFCNNPRDKAVAIDYANALADDGRVGLGEKVLNEIARQSPYDPELQQALKNISARRTMDEGGYSGLADGKGSYRDILKNEEEAKALERENRAQKTEDVSGRLIQEYETRLKTETGNMKLRRQLAGLYADTRQFDKSLQLFAELKASEMGNDPSLDSAIAETKVKQFNHHVEHLDKTAPDYEDQVARLQVEKLEFQVVECQKRVEKFPTDLAIRFEMGLLYFQTGKLTEAIQEFQKAQNNPHKHIAALNYLAQCFAKRKMYDLAARKLQEAIKEKIVFDDEKKELIYNLAGVLEHMNRRPDAFEQLKLIYEVDSGYRDVGPRVEAYYAES